MVEFNSRSSENQLYQPSVFAFGAWSRSSDKDVSNWYVCLWFLAQESVVSNHCVCLCFLEQADDSPSPYRSTHPVRTYVAKKGNNFLNVICCTSGAF